MKDEHQDKTITIGDLAIAQWEDSCIKLIFSFLCIFVDFAFLWMLFLCQVLRQILNIKTSQNYARLLNTPV